MTAHATIRNTARRLLGAAAVALAINGVWAAEGDAGKAQTAADPAVERRLKALSEELRCLVCQNQTLADSHADLAIDLRNQVEDQIRAGKSDEEIKAYLVARYGDFVLYRPPVQSNTQLLWFGPFALLALGAGVWWLVSRRSRRAAEIARADAPQDGAALATGHRMLDGD
jgi:cytochrome c-type biogenesis protein CcmH